MVSIIIINYNTYQLTCNCIQSIIDKTIDVDYEIILVDNASTEGSSNKFKQQFPHINLIENKKNVGFAKGNNIGIQHAKGEYILLLNSDTELLNDAISICKTVLSNELSIGVVSAQLQFTDGKIQHSCQSFPSIKNEIIELLRLHKFLSKDKIAELFRGSFFSHKENCYCDWVWGTFFMFRKNDLQKLTHQQLSDEFFMYGEDMEWCYQFQLAQLKSYFCKDAKIIHHMGQSDFGNNLKKTTAILRNEIRFLRKYKGLFYTCTIRILKSFKFLILSTKDKSYYQLARLYIFQK